MLSLQMAALILGVVTWVGLTLVGRRYFRHGKRRAAAKDWLLLNAFVCTVIQFVTMGLVTAPHPVGIWVGMALYVVAVLLFSWALYVHGRNRPAYVGIDVPPATFQDRGPYRMVRHPIYTAYLLAWLAPTLITAQWWLLLTVGWLGIIYYRAARREEQHFSASPFASQYDEYRNRTGMFLPKVLPFGKNEIPAKAG